MASSLWKEHKNGTFYANWDRLAQQEPETVALLRKEHFARAETDEFNYYVNYHETYGWSVGRTSKTNQQQPQKISEQQQQQPQQEQLQRLLQRCTTITSFIQEQEQKNDEILRTLNRLESKIDENNHHLHNKEQAQESNDGIMEDAGEQN